ncbi:hypothetical protein [Desulforamulus putei]|uniref:PilN domain-containing protein n=1 Tax=Desulforamulus putei TaxID=74701 RepID=UPI002FDE956D
MNYRVNLLPVELQPKPPISPKKFAVYLLCTLIVGGLGFGYGYFMTEIHSAKGELQSLDKEKEMLKGTETRINDISRQRQEMEAKINILNGLMKKTKSWPKFLQELNKHVPEGVWINKLYLIYQSPDEFFNEKGKNEAVPGSSTSKKTTNTVEEAVKEPVEQITPQETGNSQSSEQNQSNTNKKENSKEETKVPEAAPNILVIEGASYSFESIGKFIYSLNQMQYFSKVVLKEITLDKGGKYNYSVGALLKEAQP